MVSEINLYGEELIIMNNLELIRVFEQNKDFNSKHFRIPFLCTTNKGTIIAGADIRYESGHDQSLISIGTSRSEDGGKTWIDKTVAIANSGVSNISRVMDGTVLATESGRVWLLGNSFHEGKENWTMINETPNPDWDILLVYSDDDGKTWSEPRSLANLLPNGEVSFLGGVGSAIEMKDGTLVFPIQIARYNDEPYNCQSGIMYSKDLGETWKLGEAFIPAYTSECNVVECKNGELLINCREEGSATRSIYTTKDMGTTWEEHISNHMLKQNNPCMGSMINVTTKQGKEIGLFANPHNDYSDFEKGRSNIALQVTEDWENYRVLGTIYEPVGYGYSCLSYDKYRDKLYILIETKGDIEFIDITSLYKMV